jgi:hypothetical protein
LSEQRKGISTRQLRSPRSLIVEERQTYHLHTPDGFREFIKDFGHPLNDGSIALGKIDLRKEVQKLLRYFMEVSRNEGGSLDHRSDILDGKHYASGMLRRLTEVQSGLDDMEKAAAASDQAAAIASAYFSICQALAFGSWYHGWTVINNEKVIVDRNTSLESASSGGKAKAKSEREKNRNRDAQIAREFEVRRGGKLSDTALKKNIGKRFGLRSASAVTDAIKRAENSSIRKK